MVTSGFLRHVRASPRRAEGDCIFVVTRHAGRERYAIYFDRLPSWLLAPGSLPSPIVARRLVPAEHHQKSLKELVSLYQQGLL